jgi:hypothetical protein
MTTILGWLGFAPKILLTHQSLEILEMTQMTQNAKQQYLPYASHDKIIIETLSLI